MKEKQSKKQEAVCPNGKWQWKPEIREGASDNQGNKEGTLYTVYPAVRYELDRGENHVNNVHWRHVAKVSPTFTET